MLVKRKMRVPDFPTEERIRAWRLARDLGAHPTGVTATLFGKHAIRRIRVQLYIEKFLAKLRKDKEWASACELASETLKTLQPLQESPRIARRRRAV